MTGVQTCALPIYKEETITKRLEVYQEQTAPLIDYYREKGILKTVTGTGDIDEIFQNVLQTLDAG